MSAVEYTNMQQFEPFFSTAKVIQTNSKWNFVPKPVCAAVVHGLTNLNVRMIGLIRSPVCR